MKKSWIVAALFVLCSIGGIFYLLGLQAEHKTAEILKGAGLTPQNLAPDSKSLGAITYRNISLDEDSISTISLLQASFGFSQGEMLLRKLQLTGDTLDGLSISGLALDKFPYKLVSLPLQTLILRQSSLSLLTDHIGGVTVTFDAQALRKNEALEYQTRFSSAQKHLSMNGQINGTLREKEWSAEGVIEQAKFDFPFLLISASRAGGNFTLNGTAGAPAKFIGQMSAGGADVLGLPWQNLSATLEKQSTHFKITGSAKALGYENIELTINGGNSPHIVYTLFAPDYKSLSFYLADHKKSHFLKAAKIPESTENITLHCRRIPGSKSQIRIDGRAQSGEKSLKFSYDVAL